MQYMFGRLQGRRTGEVHADSLWEQLAEGTTVVWLAW